MSSNDAEPTAKTIGESLLAIAARADSGGLVRLSALDVSAIVGAEEILRGAASLMSDGPSQALDVIVLRLRLLATEQGVGDDLDDGEPFPDQIMVERQAKDLRPGDVVDLESCPFMKGHRYAQDVYGQVKKVSTGEDLTATSVAVLYEYFGVVNYPPETSLLVTLPFRE